MPAQSTCSRTSWTGFGTAGWVSLWTHSPRNPMAVQWKNSDVIFDTSTTTATNADLIPASHSWAVLFLRMFYYRQKWRRILNFTLDIILDIIYSVCTLWSSKNRDNEIKVNNCEQRKRCGYFQACYVMLLIDSQYLMSWWRPVRLQVTGQRSVFRASSICWSFEHRRLARALIPRMTSSKCVLSSSATY